MVNQKHAESSLLLWFRSFLKNVSKKNLKINSMTKDGLHVKKTKVVNMLSYALVNLLILMNGLNWFRKVLYSLTAECMKVIKDPIPSGEQIINFGTV